MRSFNVCVIPAKAGIQSPGTRGQVWMPAFAGMTLTFQVIPHFERRRRLAGREWIGGEPVADPARS